MQVYACLTDTPCQLDMMSLIAHLCRSDGIACDNLDFATGEFVSKVAASEVPPSSIQSVCLAAELSSQVAKISYRLACFHGFFTNKHIMNVTGSTYLLSGLVSG